MAHNELLQLYSLEGPPIGPSHRQPLPPLALRTTPTIKSSTQLQILESITRSYTSLKPLLLELQTTAGPAKPSQTIGEHSFNSTSRVHPHSPLYTFAPFIPQFRNLFHKVFKKSLDSSLPLSFLFVLILFFLSTTVLPFVSSFDLISCLFFLLSC